jgi:hypothetical protein
VIAATINGETDGSGPSTKMVVEAEKVMSPDDEEPSATAVARQCHVQGRACADPDPATPPRARRRTPDRVRCGFHSWISPARGFPDSGRAAMGHDRCCRGALRRTAPFGQVRAGSLSRTSGVGVPGGPPDLRTSCIPVVEST